MIKLIATDIDGTLLEEGTLNLNPEYYDVIRELRKRGVLIAAASGRQRSSIEKVFRPVIDDIIAISENGTCTYSKEYQYIDKIQPELVKAFIKEARQYPGCEVVINQDNISYFENDGIKLQLVDSYGYNGKMVDDVCEYADGACKVSVYHHRCAEEILGQDFLKRWNRVMHAVVSGERWIDCSNKGVTKGSALKHFQDTYGITPDETLAFGDNLNDIEMLKCASYSFAVANAREEVKEVANFVTLSNKEDGVLQVLKAVLRGELC